MMYGMRIGLGKQARIKIHRLQYCTRVDAFLNVDCITKLLFESAPLVSMFRTSLAENRLVQNVRGRMIGL
jgi:hypothetical protein